MARHLLRIDVVAVAPKGMLGEAVESEVSLMRWMLGSLLALIPSVASAQIFYLPPSAPAYYVPAPTMYMAPAVAAPASSFYVAPAPATSYYLAPAPAAAPQFYVPAQQAPQEPRMPDAKTQIERYYFLSDAVGANPTSPARGKPEPGRTIIREYYYVSAQDEDEATAPRDELEELDQLPLKKLEEPQKMPVPSPKEALGDEAEPEAVKPAEPSEAAEPTPPENSTEQPKPAAEPKADDAEPAELPETPDSE